MAKHTLEVTTDVEAECPHCNNDLLCIDCDSEDIDIDLRKKETFGELSASPRLMRQLDALYNNALDEGRYLDKDTITFVIDNLK